MTTISIENETFPLRTKILFLSIVLVFFVGGAWFFLGQQKHQRQQVEDNLWAIANLKARQISEWRSERIGDGLALMNHRALAESTDSYFSDPGLQQELDRITARLRFFIDQHHFTNILLLDSEKQIRLVLVQDGDTYDGCLEALDQAIAVRMPVWTSVHVTSHQDPHLAVVVPFFSHAPGDDGKRLVGTVIMINNATEFLYPMIQSWPTPSDTAETLLVRRDGDDVLFLSELRHQKDTALSLRIPVTRTDLPAAMAVEGVTGIVEGRDYRGEKVIAAIMPVPDSPWFMVSKVDAVEAFAEWRFRSILILVFLFAGLGLGVAVWFLIDQRHQKAYYRRLYKSETDLNRAHRQHAITLRAIGDSVISTDADGRVEFMNPMAEKLTGWRRETARGKDLADVFQLISEKTRVPLENPARQVVRENRGIEFAESTLLISRDRREFPVMDSASPIRDEQGAAVGAVLVFKDQTGDREYQKRIVESEEKYRLLAENTLDAIWTLDRDLVFTYVNPAIKEQAGFEPEELIGTHLREHCSNEQFERIAEIISREASRASEHQGVSFESEMLRKDGSVIFVGVRALILFDEGGNPETIQGTARDISERIERERAMQHLQQELSEARKMEAIGRLAGGVAHDYNNMLNIIVGYAELGMMDVKADDPLYENLEEIFKAAQHSAGITRKLLAFARKQMVLVEAIDLNQQLMDMEAKLKKRLGENIGLESRPGRELWPVRMDLSQLRQILTSFCDNARDNISGAGRVTIETENASFDTAFCETHSGFIPGEFVMLSFSDDGKGMSPETMENIFEPFFTTKPFGESAGLGLAVVYGIVKQNNGFLNVSSEPGEGTAFKCYFPRETAPSA